MLGIQRAEIDRVSRLLEGYGATNQSSKTEINQAFTFRDIFPRISLLLERSGLRQKERVNILLRILLFFGIGALIAFSVNLFWGLGIISGAVILEYSNLIRRIFLRAERFERDYPAMLLSLASSIRTGLDPLVALCYVSELFPADSIVRQELESLKMKVDSGTSEEDAIRSFGETIHHPDIKLFNTAFILARKEGSSLGECLQRLTRVTRHRQSFRRKSKAAIAMQRLSAFGIAICSVLIGSMQIASNPKAFLAAWENPFGFKAIIFGTLLLCTGLIWMLRMGRSRI